MLGTYLRSHNRVAKAPIAGGPAFAVSCLVAVTITGAVEVLLVCATKFGRIIIIHGSTPRVGASAWKHYVKV